LEPPQDPSGETPPLADGVTAEPVLLDTRELLDGMKMELLEDITAELLGAIDDSEAEREDEPITLLTGLDEDKTCELDTTMLLDKDTSGVEVKELGITDEGDMESPNDDRLYVDCHCSEELGDIDDGDMESPNDDKLYVDCPWTDVLRGPELALEELPAIEELANPEELGALQAPYRS
jgi:hypothetical protein